MKEEKSRSPLPLRATGIFLGLWMGALLAIAFVIVPLLFASCLPTGNPTPSASP